MADRNLSNFDADLASVVQVIPGLDVRLVFIDPEAGEDKYMAIQGLRDPTTGDDPKCCYLYQWSGGTGTRGHIRNEGPVEQPKVAKDFAEAFLEMTGFAWGSVKPGHRAQPGKYWLQQQPTPDLTAQWQYYVSDGVDGKGAGWYSYEESASAEVEELYAQHVANAREARTATRLVHSSYFTYKVRTIRRAAGEAEAMEGTGAGRVPRAAKVPKACRPMKAVGPRTMKVARVLKGAKNLKVMKAMKVKKESMIGSKKAVFHGKKEKTKTGLKSSDLMKNKDGKIVFKRRNAHGRKIFEGNLGRWVAAVSKARAELGLTGFALVEKGSALYAKTKELLASVEPHRLG
eukprot:CAMPEP_0177177648 /NCGR_PEP_ID=MMETSP0367-20130122/13908_1 /TAXON_ID=447022 ORGANISM="Scrippsiella hangoei-like, Strain SHHI-4" /NCGR_SAMPLE_ID=MMETSP0367 /ASSEMBLY_ACC=CAM_ASM_000362 /LENGTH=344 /DNA_ID=CAMNT_0018624255 /DNA_START=52 /DNA_END=1086 /DNA_ORIENTATION=-